MYDIYLDGNLIMDNLALNESNIINQKYKTGVDGKAIFAPYNGDLSRVFSFKIIGISGNDFKNKKKLLNKLKEKTKPEKGFISFVAIGEDGDNIRCNVKFIELTFEEYTLDGFVPINVELLEHTVVDNTVVKFNTFNYKAAKVTSKKTSAKTKSPFLALVNCNMKKNCGAFNVKCVKLIQKLMKKDGYYIKYNLDGQWCTFTQIEFEKWTKKKIGKKITTFNTTVKNYLKKRFK
jgi:hypothetical protein